jgi:hypothetical protein
VVSRHQSINNNKEGRAMNITVPTIAAISAALILTPAAHADDSETREYLACLQRNRITYADQNDAIRLGHDVSVDMWSGVDDNTILHKLITAEENPVTAKLIMMCVYEHPVLG